jgi:hypothetical protein
MSMGFTSGERQNGWGRGGEFSLSGKPEVEPSIEVCKNSPEISQPLRKGHGELPAVRKINPAVEALARGVYPWRAARGRGFSEVRCQEGRRA